MNKQLPIPGIPAKYRPCPSKAKGYKRQDPERQMQAALFKFLRLYTTFEPRFAVIHASLNGLFLRGRVLEIAVETGMVSGVWDVFLPLTGYLHGRRYAGLYIEMKAGNNNLTAAQEAFRDASDGSFAFVVARSEKAASTVIVEYLGVTEPAILEAIR